MLKSSEYKVYSKFIENLAKKLTKFYYSKLNKPFKVSNKLKGRGYDPVTTADKAFEKFIRNEIKKKFPRHQIIGEEFGFIGIALIFILFFMFLYYSIKILQHIDD